MSKNNFTENSQLKIKHNPLFALQREVQLSPEAKIICGTKKNNPNYFSIIFANKKFYETFFVNEFNLIGKSYDFLFSDIDLDYSSQDHQEYIRLIRAVKDLKDCSIICTISDHKFNLSKARFKITFSPLHSIDEYSNHAIFTFEKVADQKYEDEIEVIKKTNSNLVLLKNLERTLHNERLLREVGSLIISDLPIRDIAQKIAKILGEHLKADRCLVHDYKDAKTSFVVEYCNNYTKKMFQNSEDTEGLKLLTEYVSFQNYFFERHGNKDRKSSLIIAEDIAMDQNFEPIRKIYEKFSIASQISVTTAFNNKVNGGIYIHQSDKKNWLADEIELIEMIANQFSIAVDRSESIERVMISNHALMERTSQLKEALKQEKEMRQMQNEFVALVSHEFKTPLQIIDSTRELIFRKIRNYNIADESLDKSFDRIKAGIQRMNGLIHSTLNLAKMESSDGKIKLERQVFDLKSFVLEIIEKNSNLATNKQIKIVAKIEELPTEFNGDCKLLEHSITNVISNAIKYSKTNSTVKVLAKANDKKVALRVVDQGMGIPKEDLINIGQKFFRAKNTLAVAGTGIGIYLTKHFVELHGGEVVIESELNVGTSATIILPKLS